jgi:hypothetical protein
MSKALRIALIIAVVASAVIIGHEYIADAVVNAYCLGSDGCITVGGKDLGEIIVFDIIPILIIAAVTIAVSVLICKFWSKSKAQSQVAKKKETK